MAVAPDSISYPTLAVIQAHGITDRLERELIWRWSGVIADNLWGRRLARCADPVLAQEIARAFAPGRFSVIRDHLHANLVRSVAWCRAQPKPEA